MFPYYLSLGMSYEQYWYGEPWLVKAYREAEIYRREQTNYDAWLQGLYFHRAVVASMSHMSSKKTDWVEYLDYPIAMTKREKEAEKERNRQRTIRWFMSEGKDGNS
jgi:hypothetical protein